MPRLLLATANQGKIAEMRALLADCDWEIVSPAEIGLSLDVEEPERTYAGNARLKAEAYRSASGLAALADDSGLEIDALDGAPGVLSARYAGRDTAHRDKMSRVLSELRDVPSERRTARFRAVIGLALLDGTVEFTEGVCEGRIASAPRGEGGFGYDPIFLVGNGERTMAEMTAAEKNSVSHRATALRSMCERLRGLAHDDRSHSPAAPG